MNHPEINAVVFRYVGRKDNINKRNIAIRSTLLEEGQAILARTQVNGSVYLKLTLLNPRTTMKDIETILHEVKRVGGDF
jgi:L-2,4-diaminobutyrate decarboxylase